MTKPTTKKSASKKTNQHPLLHHLLVSMTYNGTVARTLLAGIFLICLLFVSILATGSLQATGSIAPAWLVSQNLVSLVVLTALFLAYDAIFVTISKIYKLPRAVDAILCFGVELGFLTFVFLPLYTTTDTYLDPAVGIILMFSPVFVLCARVLVGLLMNQNHHKKA